MGYEQQKGNVSRLQHAAAPVPRLSNRQMSRWEREKGDCASFCCSRARGWAFDNRRFCALVQRAACPRGWSPRCRLPDISWPIDLLVLRAKMSDVLHDPVSLVRSGGKNCQLADCLEVQQVLCRHRPAWSEIAFVATELGVTRFLRAINLAARIRKECWQISSSHYCSFFKHGYPREEGARAQEGQHGWRWQQHPCGCALQAAIAERTVRLKEK